jgi:hypothetical protein
VIGAANAKERMLLAAKIREVVATILAVDCWLFVLWIAKNLVVDLGFGGKRVLDTVD